MGSLGNPYLIQDIPDAPIYICAYKNNSLMRQAYLDALLGKTKIDGKLPVNIPEIAKIGHGITIEMNEKKSKILQSKPGQEIKQVIPYEVNANTENLSFLLNEAIQNKAWPGSVLLGSKDGKIFIDTIYKKQKKRIFNALKNSEPESVVKFKEVLKKIING